jgi:Flp pilus assembly pilin Flp
MVTQQQVQQVATAAALTHQGLMLTVLAVVMLALAAVVKPSTKAAWSHPNA